MKLVPLIILTISTAVDVNSIEHYTFPPKFQHNTGIMLSSDSSIYLPPESHTTIPYFPINKVSSLPYPYLPHTGTKAPVMIPTPYPLVMSSTLLPLEHDDDDDDDEEDDKRSSHFQRNNRTERNPSQKLDKRELRPKPVNFQPIDRIDMKIPFGYHNNNGPSQSNPPMQKATPRSLIISEQSRNDAMDHLRAAAAFQGPQYLPAPGASGVFLSSTTETAIPILRLSNEMDLDGSFSYEALGADQTHYVQHSRMENTGTDKEVQVVEGSYSYVGDNGQTYTVHYVADSNGFRASGDHLPVPPPVPEIIQRAIQLNLAEEAKKPPHDRAWNEEKENELSESAKYHRFSIPPPPRPLFTGKTPESFSFGFAQGLHNAQNQIINAASSQNPIKTVDFTQEQIKTNANGAPIAPQITFLASQGAHVPSVNTPSSISRVFSTERPTLPQLVNYEAAIKESEQESRDKALWRWQYGLNSNNDQAPVKNTISRSSGSEGDDVMINFGDMTSDQYSKIIRSQLEPNMENSQSNLNSQESSVENTYSQSADNARNQNAIITNPPNKPIISPENNLSASQVQDWNKNLDSNVYQPSVSNESIRPRENSEPAIETRQKIITQNNFVPQSQTVTQTYDYEESSYEPRRINRVISTFAPITYPSINYNNNYERGTQNTLWANTNQIENVQKVSTTEAPMLSTTSGNIQFSDFIVHEQNNDFKPLVPSQMEMRREEITTTTETTNEDVFKENIFLKNLFKSNKNEQYQGNKIREENKNYYQPKIVPERKPDKVPKFIQMHAKPHNEIKGPVKKPVDVTDILNYLSSKNHFESAKVKPKSKYGSNNYNHRSEVRFIPVQQDNNGDHDDENIETDSSNHQTSYYRPEELRGIIKNYKVLQRNNSAFSNGQDVEQLRRDLTPPPAKVQPNLPPLGRAGPSMKSYLPPIYI